MVLDNSTIEQINYIVDANNEYNIKLLLLGFFLISALISLYIGYRNNYETESKSLFNMFLVAYGWLVIFFLPLYLFFLLRSVDLDIIMNYVFIVYNIIMWGFFVLGFFWMFEKVFKYFFNFSFTDKKTKHRDSKEYREVEKE